MILHDPELEVSPINLLRITPKSLFSDPPDQSTRMPVPIQFDPGMVGKGVLCCVTSIRKLNGL